MTGIENNREDSQYQLFESGHFAGFVQYRMSGNEMWILHSSLSHSYKSPTLVTTLLGRVLDDARRSHLLVLPFCPAMRVFIGLHPEYASLVPIPWRSRLSNTGLMETGNGTNGPLDYVRLTGSRRTQLQVAPVVVP